MSTESHQWSFVVRFDSQQRTRGRVEHIPSGRRQSFESTSELLSFLTGDEWLLQLTPARSDDHLGKGIR